MTAEHSIQEYLKVLSSKAPVPGGGGASALAGALGSALGMMVANLTIGKKRYADVEEEMKQLLGELEEIREDFVRLADEDALVFAPLSAAYSLPASTEEEKAYKDEVMEKNLLAASLVPIRIMEKTGRVLEILGELAAKGSRLAVSDVGVAVSFVRGALLGAVMNVYINTKSMKDRRKANELNEYAERMTREGSAHADAIYEQVLASLR